MYDNNQNSRGQKTYQSNGGYQKKYSKPYGQKSYSGGNSYGKNSYQGKGGRPQQGRNNNGYTKGGNYGKGGGKPYNKYGNKPQTRKPRAPKQAEPLMDIYQTIFDTVKETVDAKGGFYYWMSKSDKKVDNGILTMTIKISDKEHQKNFKYIGVIITQDAKKTVSHINIFDDNLSVKVGNVKLSSINVFYSAHKEKVIDSLKKYVPNIINSVMTRVGNMPK